MVGLYDSGRGQGKNRARPLDCVSEFCRHQDYDWKTPTFKKRKVNQTSRHQAKKQLFEIILPMFVAQLGQAAAGEDSALADDGHPVAQFLDLAHDVAGEEDAL